jgi:membrane protease YdiL (CAAX protease family)
LLLTPTVCSNEGVYARGEQMKICSLHGLPSLPRIATLAASATLVFGCGPPLRQARTTIDQPVSSDEADAARRLEARACGPGWSVAFPGLGQLCTGKTAAGAALMTLGTAQLGTAIAVASQASEGLEHPGAALPLVGLQDVWLYGIMDTVFDRQRAARLRYVPPDTPGELVLASFNWQVLRRPTVWAGILGLTAAGVGLSVLAGERLRTGHFGDDANLFGRQFSPPVGYPLAAGVGLVLFQQVAIAEEAVFRGYVQSDIARATNPTTGWLVGSLIFGGAHALNALVLPPEKRLKYLAIGVPTITVLGSYLGWAYRRADYSLAPSVALHFWYDFLLSAVFFAADPQSSPLAARVVLPF